MKHLRLSLVAKGSLPKMSIQNPRPSANLRICHLCVTKCMTIDWQIEIGICVFSHNYDIWFLLEILTAVNVASFDDICSSLQRDFRDAAIIPSKNNNQFRCRNNETTYIVYLKNSLYILQVDLHGWGQSEDLFDILVSRIHYLWPTDLCCTNCKFCLICRLGI